MHSTQFRLTIARVVSTIRNCGRKLHMPRRDVYEPEAGGHGGGARYSLTRLRFAVQSGRGVFFFSFFFFFPPPKNPSPENDEINRANWRGKIFLSSFFLLCIFSVTILKTSLQSIAFTIYEKTLNFQLEKISKYISSNLS